MFPSSSHEENEEKRNNFLKLNDEKSGGEMCNSHYHLLLVPLWRRWRSGVCVLNPYCDLNKAIANRASHHPIWKRWAKKTKKTQWRNEKVLSLKLQLESSSQEKTKQKRRWYITYSIYLSFLCVSLSRVRKQTNPPHLILYKYVCIILKS